MSIDPKFFPTDTQTAAVASARAFAKEAIDRGFAEARRAHDAIVSLPHVNADGTTVRHGANKTVMHVRDCILASMQYLKDLDREYYDLVRYRSRHVNNGFVSEEVYAKDFPHITAEIARLEKKIAER